MRPRDRAPAEQVALAAFAIGVLVLVSPLRFAWAHEGAPWWSPFAAWAALVALAALVARHSGRKGAP
jgi:VIT1/CCC1 family predicted Fe2+/Mn2+ transporter